MLLRIATAAVLIPIVVALVGGVRRLLLAAVAAARRHPGALRIFRHRRQDRPPRLQEMDLLRRRANLLRAIFPGPGRNPHLQRRPLGHPQRRHRRPLARRRLPDFHFRLRRHRPLHPPAAARSLARHRHQLRRAFFSSRSRSATSSASTNSNPSARNSYSSPWSWSGPATCSPTSSANSWAA